MKTFQAIFNEEEVDGVFGISLVHDPAMEGVFVALKKEEIQLKEIDKEQRILMGLVLEPNKPVYRNQNGEEFNIVFNEQTVKDLSYHFFKSNSHKNSTIEHDAKQRIEGVTFVESWIVEDPKNDKQNIYGFSYPKGSWIATMKVDSDDIWNNYVKTGKVQGFSIDAMLSLKEVNLKSDIIMSEIKDTLKDFANEVLMELGIKKNPKDIEADVVEIKMGSIKAADGSLAFEYEGETPMAGSAIWVVAEDGTKVPVPAGEYPLEDGSVLTITNEGVIESVGMPEMPAEETPMAEEPSAPNTGGSDAQSVINQVQESIKSIMIKYAEEQDRKLEEIKKELLELKEQPAAKKINSNPVQKVELNSKGRLLSKLRNN